MTREIKFRGQRTDTNTKNGTREWVYGYFYKGKREDVGDIPLGNCRIFWNIITEEGIIYEVIPETVGQYTGLKDKKGKEIYEGDIVTGDHRGTLDIVDFSCGCFLLRNAMMHYEATYWGDEIVVMGNIHEATEEQKKELELE